MISKTPPARTIRNAFLPSSVRFFLLFSINPLSIRYLIRSSIYSGLMASFFRMISMAISPESADTKKAAIISLSNASTSITKAKLLQFDLSINSMPRDQCLLRGVGHPLDLQRIQYLALQVLPFPPFGISLHRRYTTGHFQLLI